jgi:hypothetical protein
VLDRQIEVHFSLEKHNPKGRKITQEEWENMSAEKIFKIFFWITKISVDSLRSP